MTQGFEETVADDGAPSGRLVAGGRLGKYELERELGAGGMGVVWIAHDPDLDRSIAIKLLRSEVSSAAQRTRLLREARAMARLHHPNVLTVHEVVTDEDRDYIVMELVDGASLDAWLASKPPRRQVWDALIAAGRGLAAAHAAGLVHRDFKPHNVLRSRDGRVMVTDFGLARGVVDEATETERQEPIEIAATLQGVGPLDQTVAPSSQSSRPRNKKSDPVLDSPLTQTGMLLGTPAYMAPEQYAGEAADPRTDQFAYCVTAWQALAGERPFRGATLEELQRAVEAGVEHVRADLPRALRRVLARGLERDPARRWPDMTALLGALERAEAAPRRARRLAATGVVFALAGLLAVRIWQRPAVEHKTGPCAHTDRAFDSAYAPVIADALAQHGVGKPAIAALDDVRARWTVAYKKVCSAQDAPSFHQRLGCLTGMREYVGELTSVYLRWPPGEPPIDMIGEVARVESCEGPAPPTPPPLPDDAATRAKIADLHVRARLELELRPVADFEAAARSLEADARATGWPPLVGQVLLTAAAGAHKRGRIARARELLDEADREATAARDVTTEAIVQLERAELTMVQQVDPRDDQELAHVVERAHAAIEAAGGDPAQLAVLDSYAAQVELVQGDPDRAIAGFEHARNAQLAAHDAIRAAHFALFETQAYLARDRSGDGEAADKVLRDTKQRSGQPLGERAKQLHAEARAEIAWHRGDLDDAHRHFDNAYEAAPPDGPAVSGRVIGIDGAPVEGATVVAWRGELVGDGRRLYRARGTLHGDVATTDRDGNFTVHGDGGAVIAELGELRSVPQPLASGAVIKLATTRVIVGRVSSADQPTTGVDAFARFDLRDASFVVAAPLARDGSFQLGRVPSGDSGVGARAARGYAGHAIFARGKPGEPVAITWPVVPPLDVVVGGALDEPARAIVLRGKVVPKTAGELAAAIAKSTDVASEAVGPVGAADATPAGRAVYEKTDRHVVFDAIGEGDVVACAVLGERLACTPTQVRVARSVENRDEDGTLRHHAPANVVRVELPAKR